MVREISNKRKYQTGSEKFVTENLQSEEYKWPGVTVENHKAGDPNEFWRRVSERSLFKSWLEGHMDFYIKKIERTSFCRGLAQ
jgi:hypothetical protein